MKFYEYILNSSSYRADTILSRNCYLKVQRNVTQKVSIQELWFLHSAHRLMLVNICLKFHEDTITVLKLQNGCDFVLETATYKV